MSVPDKKSRYKGALLGLAAGDALGTTLEFREPGTFQPITDMVGGGPFSLRRGQWTDDTSMALCLAASLIEKEKMNPGDQMERYWAWYREGYMSSNGTCFDIGNTVHAALLNWQETGQANAGSKDPFTAGNGSIMRLAPVPMAYSHSPKKAIKYAAQSSLTTHGAVQAVDACRFFGGLLTGALNGTPKEELLVNGYSPVWGSWNASPLDPKIDAIANGSYKNKSESEISGSGYVVESLEAALWCFYTTDTFEEGALKAANLGKDADTTAAIFGQLAGACYGIDGIPKHWRDLLAKRELLEVMALQLYDLSQRKI